MLDAYKLPVYDESHMRIREFVPAIMATPADALEAENMFVEVSVPDA
jgi:hypothetical protein